MACPARGLGGLAGRHWPCSLEVSRAAPIRPTPQSTPATKRHKPARHGHVRLRKFKPSRLFTSPLQSYAFPCPPSLTRTFHPKLPPLLFAIPAAAWSMRCNTIDRRAFQPYHSERVPGRLGELSRTRRPFEASMKHRYGDGSSHPSSQKVHQCNTIHLDGTWAYMRLFGGLMTSIELP